MFTLFGEYIQHYDGEIWVGSLVQLMNRFGISESSVRGAIFRMVKQNYLKTRKVKNKSYYSLTDEGKRNVIDGVHRVYTSRNFMWDKKWRILTYSFPEEKRELRNQIRKELNWLGFGLISNSTWINPNPVEKQVKNLIHTYELEDNVTFLTSSEIVSPSTEKIINKGWDLKRISKQYNFFIDSYIDKLEKLREKAFNDQLTNELCFIERTSLVHEFRKFLFEDPGFPIDLQPSYWSGTKAYELFGEIHQLLALPAVRFFDSTFKGPPDQEITPNRHQAINPFPSAYS
ncbi:PaaX family transcriptional regulator C-terminal domain-containing protein [Lentibacillus salinarum]|uniref:PaaX family transcriptional regulator C-terminal domain-containing protein n=2 Tax=Lentibacillus salinarum TaxID=446820 RepID=A0ABW3ZRP2_9BACI